MNPVTRQKGPNMSHGSVDVPRSFVEDFEVVSRHYLLRELGEYELAKQAAREDIENAITCFAALREEIERGR